ncbi:nitroreductase family protein [Mobilitalea sibirica]|uniref:Nitroreductase family protein n=2 Tax=Mobilitalea sibirica TaxID=1462919 RepID=A0A8J7KUZ6_9FIRM|nr:nitroreductase family protein [Mobilitalea sibirica]MBH1939565.1 nitroreductase family protein [Mobilitalea sibirica]
MTKDFFKAIEERRTFYEISKESVLSNDEIKEIIEHAVKYTPSAFNSQSARVVLLTGKHHDKLWNITKETLRKIITPDQFTSTEEKINSFQNGFGTVLFFEDNNVIETLQQQFALYKDNFLTWSQQSSGMLQFVLWTALEIGGFGASLQHYNELIELKVKEEWNIPNSWKLIAQMPFGKPTASPVDKQFLPLEERIEYYI